MDLVIQDDSRVGCVFFTMSEANVRPEAYAASRDEPAHRAARRATFERPHQYSIGVRDVFVNGTQVLRGGEHTGATPGRFVRGPGWRGRPSGR